MTGYKLVTTGYHYGCEIKLDYFVSSDKIYVFALLIQMPRVDTYLTTRNAKPIVLKSNEREVFI